MSFEPASVPSAPLSPTPPVVLGGRRLLLARIVWIVVALLTLALFVAGVPIQFANLQAVCVGSVCLEGQLSPENAGALQQLGLSLGFYAAYIIMLIVIFTGVFFAVGTVIFWRKSDEWMALFVSLILVTFGVTFPRTLDGLEAVHPALGVLVESLDGFGFTSLFLLFYLFPDGRFVPRWTLLLAIVWIAIVVLPTFFPNSPFDLNTWPDLLELPTIFGLFGSFVFAQIYRYWRVSNPVQRQQTKWVVFGMTIAIVGFIGAALPGDIFPWFTQPGVSGLLYEAVSSTVYIFSFLFIPLTIGIAILRYRLWDVDFLINRTLVYGSLTASVVGFYILLVGGLGALFQTGGRGSVLISLLATAVVAVLFAPLRDRLQRGVNRLLYGQRDDPYAVLSRLGQQLEATLAPIAVLPTIITTVKEALKLPYAAIALDQEGRSVEVAVAGTLTPNPLCLPLSYQGETIGQLILVPRGPGETFTPAERRLLDDLAHQAGIAAAAVRLTADLQHSRERLVTAREEERRRLRRDLHDGLGPALAAHTLKIGSARALLQRDPAAADALLTELESDTQTALADIRRLVYNLRPPALDELGLIGAIRENATNFGFSISLCVPSADFGLPAQTPPKDTRDTPVKSPTPNQPCLVIEAPVRLPSLPAAAEVAAYRIVQEALTNVVRHAQAQHCTVKLAIRESMIGDRGRGTGDELREEVVPGPRSPVSRLQLEITDDGVGLPPERHVGVGLASMRERSLELGGTCQIESVPTGGVRVVAWLPLPKKEELKGTEGTEGTRGS